MLIIQLITTRKQPFLLNKFDLNNSYVLQNVV